MQSCRCLDLSNGRLARELFLPEKLTSLTSLRLGHNGIKGIQDATMLALTALTWLELHDNHLSVLPQDWKLWDLKGLLLHNNNITQLPQAISQLSSLTTLTRLLTIAPIVLNSTLSEFTIFTWRFLNLTRK